MSVQLTMGPILFNWKPETWRDFYFRIADEAPVQSVYIGEVICSKRAPFFEPLYDEVAQRLQNSGKNVIFSSLAEVMIKRERKMTQGLCELEDFMVEANDTSALYHLRGKPHAVGPFFNVYNEEALEFLAEKGATHVTLPPELPGEAMSILGQKAKELGVTLEVQVYGRVPLALSARCYHARAHNKVKDNCLFVCEQDPDGMDLKTLSNEDFLSINGIQTLSYTYLNLIQEMAQMQEDGIYAFRLSPHTHDMVYVAQIFRDVLDKKTGADEAKALLEALNIPAPFSNGFFYSKPGCEWVDGSFASSGTSINL